MGGWSERVMGQKGFFDVERRLEAISSKGDPLEMIKKIVPWEDFRAGIEAVTLLHADLDSKGSGRARPALSRAWWISRSRNCRFGRSRDLLHICAARAPALPR